MNWKWKQLQDFISVIPFIVVNVVSYIEKKKTRKPTSQNLMDWHEFCPNLLDFIIQYWTASSNMQLYYALKTTDIFISRWPISFRVRSPYIQRQKLSLPKGVVNCKELLYPVREEKKTLILDSRSETQWLTQFWWKLWAWMTSLKKEHGIREKAICFKTVIWSGCFFGLFCSSARAGFFLISKNVALSCVLFVHPMICWSHKHMAALLTRSRQQGRHLKSTHKGVLLQCALSHSPRKVLTPCCPFQYTTCSVSSSPKTDNKGQITS